MCGIAGFASARPIHDGDRRLQRMCDSIRHRGPDDDGLYTEANVGLGMRRLSIIDLVSGKQPIRNEDGEILTVFNGEIYNFRELRRELSAHGHVFRTNSDTEVIVHAYEQWGLEFPKRLNGMFGIALLDRRQQKVILVRDHIGIKPLYYAWHDGVLAWGSEIKAILAGGFVPRELDVQSLSDFLAWEYCPAPGTLLKHVRKLQPGRLLSFDLRTGSLTESTFWKLQPRERQEALNEEAWLERVDAGLKEAVSRQSVSDVPLGAFLSGGVDSSLIVAAMENPRTFSIGFEDPSYNELSYSQTVARHLDVDHTTEVIRQDSLNWFQDLLWHMDDPIGDSSIFPTYLVSRLARQHVKVVLSGDGGDELFAGYDAYQAAKLARLYERIPKVVRNGAIHPALALLRPQDSKKGLTNKLIRFAEGMGNHPSIGHARWRVFLTEALRQALFSDDSLALMTDPIQAHVDSLYADAQGFSPLDRELAVDTGSYLPDDILTKVDRMSMAVSLEARVPFLDLEMIDLAFAVPTELKLRGWKTKYLLKKLAERKVPLECVYRSKEGFSAPLKTWLAGPYRDLMESALARHRIEQQGLFRWDTVHRLKTEHLSGRRNHSHLLWGLMMFQSWSDMWLQSDAARQSAA